MRPLPLLVLVNVLLLLPLAASAEEAIPVPASEVSVALPQPAPARNFVNFRIGGGSTSERPRLCLEASPHDRFSIEACGTGSGFLHHDEGPETAHFRGRARLHRWTTRWGQLEPLVGVGFAEVQLGEDDPGFRFRDVGPRGVETTGPEASVSLRHVLPIAAGLELVGDLSMGTVYLPNAPKLVRPMSPVLPWVSVTVGAGF